MSHKRVFAGLTALAFASVAYAAPTGPVSRVIDAGPPSEYHAAVTPAAFLLTTGFEDVEGWDVNFQICGANFAAGCGSMPGNLTGGFANVCVPKNHAASINCCFNDPNDRTGWWLSGSSQHCSEPSIRNVHAATGSNHLRFQFDPLGGNPPGCQGMSLSACRQSGFSTSGANGPLPDIAKVTFSVDIAGSATLGANQTIAVGEFHAPAVYLNTYAYFYYLGGIYEYSFADAGFVFGGYWSDFAPDYRTYQVILDPCNDTVTFSYAGTTYQVESYGFTPPAGAGTDTRNPTSNATVYLNDHYGETWDLDNQSFVYESCPDACCDGTTGICADGVAAGDCMGDQQVWYENVYCAAVECIRHSGACCDASPGAGGPEPAGVCTDGTYPEGCDGQYQTWYKSELCADLAPCLEVTGACCNTLAGTCTDNQTQADCSGPQRVWSVEQACADVACDAVLGACCDGDTFGSCTQTTNAGCACPKCQWHKLELCDDIDCTHEAIPTVSEWGLVVLTLLLLTGAKVYFGRRQALA